MTHLPHFITRSKLSSHRSEVSEPHTIVVKVYFAEVARMADIAWNKTTSAYLHKLKCDQGVYLASTQKDYEALRPHEIR